MVADYGWQHDVDKSNEALLRYPCMRPGRSGSDVPLGVAVPEPSCRYIERNQRVGRLDL